MHIHGGLDYGTTHPVMLFFTEHQHDNVAMLFSTHSSPIEVMAHDLQVDTHSMLLHDEHRAIAFRGWQRGPHTWATTHIHIYIYLATSVAMIPRSSLR